MVKIETTKHILKQTLKMEKGLMGHT